MKTFTTLTALAVLMAAPGVAWAQSTLERVVERGELRCAVGDPTPGWHALNSDNEWTGFGVDYCRAIATAVLGDPDAAVILSVGFNAAFDSVRSGEADVITTSHTFKLEREAGLGMNFPAVYFYSGTTVMVRESLGIESFADLAGATICYTAGSANEASVSSWFRTNGLEYNALTFEALPALSEAYAGGRCDAFANEPPTLAGFRVSYDNPDEHVVLPELFAVDAFGPLVAEGDEQWTNVVASVVYSTIFADIQEVTSENVDDVLGSSNNPEILRLLGQEGEHGSSLGLAPDWALGVIRTVGSYSEIFERNLGEASGINLDRGKNTIARDGGLLHAPAF